MNGNSEVVMDELDQLLSMNELSEIDVGKFVVRYLQGSERVYILKDINDQSLMKTMANFRKQGLFCDVSFLIHGTILSAHKIVLASASQYFAAMFSNNKYIESQTNQPIDLTNVLPCSMIFETILEFLYTSEIHINEKFVSSVKKLV